MPPTSGDNDMRWKLCSWMMLCLLCGGLLLAADGKPAFTNPADAGPDFATQGEYSGTLGEHKWGVQVVALGEGKFDIAGHRGGLPGDGWRRGDDTRLGKGERKNDTVDVTGDTWTAKIKDGVMTVFHDANKVGELKKVERKSPTLGAAPPAGAIVLFDGTSAEHFDKGQIVEGDLLGATGCVSKHAFGDHSLHVEFRTPF